VAGHFLAGTYLTKNGDQIVRAKGAAKTSMATMTDADAARCVTVRSSMVVPDISLTGISVETSPL